MNEALTITAMGLGAYAGLTSLLFLYPGEYDTSAKQRLTKALLLCSITGSLVGAGTLVLLMSATATPFEFTSQAVPCLWGGVCVLLALLLFVHLPIAFAFQRMNRDESALWKDVTRLTCDVLYADDVTRPTGELEEILSVNAALLRERGLQDLTQAVIRRTRDSGIRPLDLARLLLERATSIAGAAGSRPTTPFRGLNEMFTAAGAGIIVGLSVQLALRGGT